MEERKFKIAFESPYYFGDFVAFDSVNGKGEGRVIDIIFCQDGSIYYTIEFEEGGDCLTGIYPHEMRLVRSHMQGEKKGEKKEDADHFQS